MATLTEQLSLVSGSSIDHYSLLNLDPEALDEQHFYAAFQVAIKEGYETILSEYGLKVSIWNSSTSRLSRDAQLECHPDGVLALFELPEDPAPADSQTYCFVDLIHRDTAISVASGSAILNPQSKLSSGTRSSASATVEDLASKPFSLQTVSIELHLSENFRHWVVPKEFTCARTNGRTVILLQAYIGCIMTTGRVRGVSHLCHTMAGYEGAEQSVIVVPPFHPSLLDCLSVAAPTQPTGHDRQDCAVAVAARLESSVWHLTVEDLQLTSDILDLYVDRNILISAACGGAASLSPHTYLGHIRQYQGNYVEKAEISIISPTPSTLHHISTSTVNETAGAVHTLSGAGPGDSSDIYRSCLTFEVKVMECAASAGMLEETEGVHLDRYVLCTGVLHRAHKIAELDGTPAESNNDAGDGEAELTVLNPGMLTSGVYEALLYTVYHPESDLDITLVGKVTVTLHAPSLDLGCGGAVSTSAVGNGGRAVKVVPVKFDYDVFCAHPDKRVAFAHWLACFGHCCRTLTSSGTTAPERSAGGSGDGAGRRAALRELEQLLRVLALPEYAESGTWEKLTQVLFTTGEASLNEHILPALQLFFHDWLAGEALTDIMTAPAEPGHTSTSASPARPPSPAARAPLSPLPGSPSRAISPGRGVRKALVPPPKATSAFEFVPDPPWEQVATGVAGLRLLCEGIALSAGHVDGDDFSLSTGLSKAGDANVDSLDAIALMEIAEDLSCALFQQMSRVLTAWRSWYVDVKETVMKCKGRVKLGQDCIERLQRGMGMLTLLLSVVPQLSAETVAALTALCGDVRTFCADIAVAAVVDDTLDAAAEEDWRLWMSAQVGEILVRLLRVAAAHMHPNNDAQSPLPGTVCTLLAAVDSWVEAKLWCGPQWQLILTLTETVALWMRRVSLRLASFPVADATTSDLAATLGFSLTIWRPQEEEEDTKPVVKLVLPPAAVRKANRRATAVGLHGIDVTLEALSTPVAPAAPAAPTSVTGGGLFGAEEHDTVGVVVDWEQRKQIALAAPVYAEEAVLFFLCENIAFLRTTQAVVDCLQALQPSGPSGAGGNGNGSVGMLTALTAVMDTVDDLSNALLRGRVLNPELLKELVKTATDSNGLPGQGLVLFVDFYTWARGQFFDFFAHSPNLAEQVDAELLHALAHRMESTVAFHFCFFDIMREHARLDRHLSRAAWLSYKGETAAAMEAAAFPVPVVDSAAAPLTGAMATPVRGKSGAGTSTPRSSSAGGAAAAAFLSSQRNKRAEDSSAFSAASSTAVVTWLAVRAALRQTLHVMCVCAVKLADAADEKCSLAGPMQVVFPPSFLTAFSHAVMLLCRCLLMVDIGPAMPEVATAVLQHTPLHTALQLLFRLAESLPVSLQQQPATSSSGTSTEVPNPLTALMAVMVEMVSMDLALHQADAQVPQPSTVISALAQLLDHHTIMAMHHSKNDALFNIKILLRGLISNFLLVAEDPRLSAQPVIKIRKPGEDSGTATGPQRVIPVSAFPSQIVQTLIATVTTTWPSAVSFNHFQREYELHLTSLKMLLCARHVLVNGDPLLSGGPSRHQLLRGMFEKVIFSSSVTNMIAYGMQYMNCGVNIMNSLTDSGQSVPITSENLLSMVELLARTFSPNPEHHSSSGGAGASELLSVFGCSFKAHHDVLRMLIHHYRDAAMPIDATKGPVHVYSEASKRLETEIAHLRHCIQWLLRSGQWETGLEIAAAYLEKFKSASAALRVLMEGPLSPGDGGLTGTGLMSPFSPTRSVSVNRSSKDSLGSSSPLRGALSPGSPHHFTFDVDGTASSAKSSPTKRRSVLLGSPVADAYKPPPPQPPPALPAAGAVHSHIKRYETVKAELLRVIDTFQSRINADGGMRLFSHYYAVLFVSDRPWEVMTGDDTLKAALSHIHTDRLQQFSATWLHASSARAGGAESIAADAVDLWDTPMRDSADLGVGQDSTNGASAATPVTESGGTGLYEYWLVLKFDATSYPIVADFYDDLLFSEQERRTAMAMGVSDGSGGGGDLSLQSPISYHNLQAQLAMAFPAFSMVTSHHQIENYLGENHSLGLASAAMAASSGAAGAGGGAVGGGGSGMLHGQGHGRPVGSVNYMQLFQAFPADICDTSSTEAVVNALQTIQDAKTATTTVTAENLLNSSLPDLLGEGVGEQAAQEEKTPGDEEEGDAPVPASRDAALQAELQKYTFAAPCPTRFYAYTLLSEDQLTVMNDVAHDRTEAAESSAYIYRYEISISEAHIDYSVLGQQPPPSTDAQPDRVSRTARPAPTTVLMSPGKDRNPRDRDNISDTASRLGESRRAATAVASATAAPTVVEKVVPKNSLNSFCISPVNLAVHRNSTRCTPVQASLEMLYYHAILVRRALGALQQLNEFSKTELAKERIGDIVSSDSLVAGVFTLLSNLLAVPGVNCCGFPNMETILVSEQERIELEWQAERKDAKRAYVVAMEEYEADKANETVSAFVQLQKMKKWKKLMKVKPTEPDLEALRAAFDAQPGHARLRTLTTLHDEAQLLVWKTLKELRKFVMAKEEQAQEKSALAPEELRQIAMKRGRRPTVTSMVLQSNLADHLVRSMTHGEGNDEPVETEKSLKMKLCLYLESLFGAMEVGVPV